MGKRDWNTPTYGYDQIDLTIKLDTNTDGNAISPTTFRDKIFVEVTAVNDSPSIHVPTNLVVAEEDRARIYHQSQFLT